jgi:hypothetical protein
MIFFGESLSNYIVASYALHDLGNNVVNSLAIDMVNFRMIEWLDARDIVVPHNYRATAEHINLYRQDNKDLVVRHCQRLVDMGAFRRRF